MRERKWGPYCIYVDWNLNYLLPYDIDTLMNVTLYSFQFDMWFGCRYALIICEMVDFLAVTTMWFWLLPLR